MIMGQKKDFRLYSSMMHYLDHFLFNISSGDLKLQITSSDLIPETRLDVCKFGDILSFSYGGAVRLHIFPDNDFVDFWAQDRDQDFIAS